MSKKRKMSPALSWIIKEAKKLKREYPNRFKKWTDYVAQASAIYSSKHRGKSPVGHKHKKLSGMAKQKKSSSKRRAAVKRVKRLHASEGRAIKRLSAIGSAKRTYKKRLESHLYDQVINRFKLSERKGTKTRRKKISKKISEIRRKLRLL